jgi:hypothetical protein
VLYPAYKFAYFKALWTGNEAGFIRISKAKLKKIWEDSYKKEVVLQREKSPPVAPRELSYLESILQKVAPAESALSLRPLAHRDQLFLYLEEPVIRHIGLMEY